MILIQRPPIDVAVVGPFNIPELGYRMGKKYRLKAFRSLAQTARTGSAIVLFNPIPSTADWLANRDHFVSDLDKQIAQLRQFDPKAKLFVVVPGATDLRGYDADTLEQQVAPLIRQAADESHAATIPIQATPSESEQIAESITDFSVDKAQWRLVGADSEESDEGPAINAIDGNPNTYWHTRYSPKPDKYPHQLVVDMGSELELSGFRYLPRQDGGTNGRIKKYEFYVSEDGVAWNEAVAKGQFANTPKASIVRFAKPVKAKFFKFVALSEQSNEPYASAAEIDVIPAP